MTTNGAKTTPVAVTLSLAFALLMALPAFAPAAEAVLHYTQAAQDNQITKDWGAGAPYGTWDKTNEQSVFYYHGLAGCGDGGAAATTQDCAEGATPQAPTPGGLPATPLVAAEWW